MSTENWRGTVSEGAVSAIASMAQIMTLPATLEASRIAAGTVGTSVLKIEVPSESRTSLCAFSAGNMQGFLLLFPRVAN